MKGKQTILGRIATYVNDKVDTSLLDNSTYISTDSMLPNAGGIVNSVNLPKGKATAFKKGDILYSNIRPYFRKVWHADFDGGCSNDVLVIRANDALNSDYLFYLLSTTNFSDYVMGGSNGTKMPRGNKDFTLTYPINLPSPHEQNRMATILSRYDELIETNNHRIALLEMNASELYKEWFVRFRFPGWKKAKFVGGLPEGWNIKTIDDVCKISVGKDKPSIYSDIKTDDCNIPIYSNGIVNDGLYGYTNEATIKEPSVTVSARGTIGFSCLRLEPFVPIVRLIVLTPKEGMSYSYLYLWAEQNTIIGNGTSQQQVTSPMIAKKDILIPSKTVMNRFADKVGKLLIVCNQLKSFNSLLSTQRDRLIPRLLSGELAV